MGSFSVAMTKRSPYSIFMKQIIYEMIERGQLHQLQKKWEIRNPQCHPIQKKGKPLSLQKLTSGFMVLPFGIICALIILFVENIYHVYGKYSKQMKHTTNKEVNKARLQDFFNRFKKILNNDDVFLKIDMKTFLKEMKHHNILLENCYNVNTRKFAY